MSTKDVENSIQFLKESRRAHERFHYEMSLGISIDGTEVEGSSHNLSLGGIFVSFTGKVKMGDTITLKMELPGVPISDVQAQVRWVIPKDDGRVGCGLKFIHLNDPLLKAIVKLSANEELREV